MLADINTLGISSRQGDDLGMDQAVVQDDVALAQKAGGLERQEFGVARACPNEVQSSGSRWR